MKLRNHGRKLSLRTICIIFCLGIVVGVSTICFSHVRAAGADIDTPVVVTPQCYDKYTDSDFLYDPVTDSDMEKGIVDYKGQLMGEKLIARSEGGVGYFEVEGDDPIVHIIPRELFAHRGQYLYVGKEYGFFVNTGKLTDRNAAMFSGYDNTNIVTVMVFDITTMVMNNPEFLDHITQKVEPIFQCEYVFATQEDDFNTAKYQPSNAFGGKDFVAYRQVSVPSGITDVILPVPYVVSDIIQRYDEVDTYYLKDIMTGVSLFNENALNVSDSAYDASADAGSYIIGTDYRFKGVGRPKASGAVGNTVADILSYGIGFLPIPYLDVVTKVAEGIQLNVQLGTVSQRAYVRETISSGSYFDEFFYNTREKQLNAYGKLLRTAYVGVSGEISDDTKPLLFGRSTADNYAMSLFQVSETQALRTRTLISLSLNVVTSTFHGEQLVKSGCNQYDSFYNGEEQTIEHVNETVQGYNLPGGGHKFSFTPQYSGEYSFENLSLAAALNVTVYSATATQFSGEVQPNAESGTFFLQEGQRYIINTAVADSDFCGALYFFKIYLSPEELPTMQRPGILQGGDYQLFSLTPESLTSYTVQWSGTNVYMQLYDEDMNLIAGYNDWSPAELLLNPQKNIFMFFNTGEQAVAYTVSCSKSRALGVNETVRGKTMTSLQDAYFDLNVNVNGNHEVAISQPNLSYRLIEDGRELSVTADNRYFLSKEKDYIFQVRNRTGESLTADICVKFVPETVAFGTNTLNFSGAIGYEFIPNVTAEYQITAGSGCEVLGIYDAALQRVSDSTLTKGNKYYIELNKTNAQILNPTLLITVDSRELAAETEISAGTRFYRFTAARSGNYRVKLTNASGITLYDQKLTPIASNAGGELTAYLLGGSNYYFGVTDFGGGSKIKAEYEASGAEVSNAYKISSTAVFRFVPKYSESYVFYTNSRASASLTTQIILYDSAFRQLTQSAAGRATSVEYAVTANNVYFIEIQVTNANAQSCLFGIEYKNPDGHIGELSSTDVLLNATTLADFRTESNTSKKYTFTAPASGQYDIVLFVGSFMADFTAALYKNGTKLSISVSEETDILRAYRKISLSGGDVLSVVLSEPTLYLLLEMTIVNSYTALEPVFTDLNGNICPTVYRNGVYAVTLKEHDNPGGNVNLPIKNVTIVYGSYVSVRKLGDIYYFSVSPVYSVGVQFKIQVDYLYTHTEKVGTVAEPVSYSGGFVFDTADSNADGYVFQFENNLSYPNSHMSLVSMIDTLYDKNGTVLRIFTKGELQTVGGKEILNLRDYLTVENMRIGVVVTLKNQRGEECTKAFSYSFAYPTYQLGSIVNVGSAEYVTIDARTSVTNLNKKLIIPTNVKFIRFVGDASKVYTNFSIEVTDSASPLVILFDNFRFESQTDSSALKSMKRYLVMVCVGNNSMQGKSAENATLNCWELYITGNTLTVQGYNGLPYGSIAAFVQVVNSYIKYFTVFGGNGGSGGNGGDGMRAGSITLQSGTLLTAWGGGGGFGTKGRNQSSSTGVSAGENGTNGGSGGRGLWVTGKIYKLSGGNYSAAGGGGGCGGHGGNSYTDGKSGGRGGNGGDGGFDVEVLGVSSIGRIRGMRGEGGNGGVGGNSSSTGTTGGRGGNSGKPGLGSVYYLYSPGTVGAIYDGNVYRYGLGGRGGNGCDGGVGSNGGDGGHGYVKGGDGGNGGSTTNAFKRGGVGGVGGDSYTYGFKGGAGGVGGAKMNFPGTSGNGGGGGKGYNGATGGNGGAAGATSGAAKGSAGANGATVIGTYVYNG